MNAPPSTYAYKLKEYCSGGAFIFKFYDIYLDLCKYAKIERTRLAQRFLP